MGMVPAESEVPVDWDIEAMLDSSFPPHPLDVLCEDWDPAHHTKSRTEMRDRGVQKIGVGLTSIRVAEEALHVIAASPPPRRTFLPRQQTRRLSSSLMRDADNVNAEDEGDDNEPLPSGSVARLAKLALAGQNPSSAGMREIFCCNEAYRGPSGLVLSAVGVLDVVVTVAKCTGQDIADFLDSNTTVCARIQKSRLCSGGGASVTADGKFNAWVSRMQN